MKKGLVLSGGGALGSYQIGVYKALLELGIKFDIITGTSVGAINGAMFVQNDFKLAKKVWNEITFNNVFDADLKFDIGSKKGSKEVALTFAKNFVSKGGMDPVKMESQVSKYLKPEKFFKSDIDFGLVTVKLPLMKPVNVLKSEMKKEELKDYIVASATCFPIFQTKKIKNSEFIDGGYRDNFPVDLAISMGATEIVAVDLFGFSKNEVKKKKDAKIVYITPNNKIGNFMEFSPKRAKANIVLGYNDTMKVFKKLEGKYYTFKKDSLKSNFDKIKDDYKLSVEKLFNLGKKKSFFKETLFKTTDYYKLTQNEKYFQKTIYSSVEHLGKSLKINVADVYSLRRFNSIALKKLFEVDISRLTTIEKKIASQDVLNLFGSKVIIKYIFEQIEKSKKNRKIKTELSKTALLLPKEFISALYLYTIYQRKQRFLPFL